MRNGLGPYICVNVTAQQQILKYYLNVQVVCENNLKDLINGSESGTWGRVCSCEPCEPSHLDFHLYMKIVNWAHMHEMTVYQPHF